ncbi:unnamed protein product [Chondrus crispus]|uniref:Uncharacterized protein n=1 Tax=Chondrus crispus TaxID=2769 RepID=R7QKH6_CHOCR|nr:unnamed protein product [Chondrus crispus]CDF38283.1 unnamed protein product [Chondrus crispus]|eukprot:XP_005718168.1 unnamed protein product [Chondrus crispus]
MLKDCGRRDGGGRGGEAFVEVTAAGYTNEPARGGIMQLSNVWRGHRLRGMRQIRQIQCEREEKRTEGVGREVMSPEGKLDTSQIRITSASATTQYRSRGINFSS